eukprot:7041209-Karenia_brevis.AAC.1
MSSRTAKVRERSSSNRECSNNTGMPQFHLCSKSGNLCSAFTCRVALKLASSQLQCALCHGGELRPVQRLVEV